LVNEVSLGHAAEPFFRICDLDDFPRAVSGFGYSQGKITNGVELAVGDFKDRSFGLFFQGLHVSVSEIITVDHGEIVIASDKFNSPAGGRLKPRSEVATPHSIYKARSHDDPPTLNDKTFVGRAP